VTLSVWDCFFAVNWCQHWLEYFPNPPLNVLSLAENVLAHHDKELLQHFVACGITSQVKDVDKSVYMTQTLTFKEFFVFKPKVMKKMPYTLLFLSSCTCGPFLRPCSLRFWWQKSG